VWEAWARAGGALRYEISHMAMAISAEFYPAAFLNNSAFRGGRPLSIPLQQKRPHQSATPRRYQSYHDHSLITVGKRWRSRVASELPEQTICMHVMVGVAWQIVLQRIGNYSLAIPSVTILDRLALQTHQPVMLNVIYQFMDNPTDERGGEKSSTDHSRVLDCAPHNPAALRSALRITALYIHLGPFARHAAAALERKISDEDAALATAAIAATA